MWITQFSCLTNSYGEGQEVAWEDFAEALLERGVPEYSSKQDVPLWAPYKSRGDRRLQKHVEQYYCLVVDYDECSEEQILDVLESVEEYEHLVHSSFSYTDQDCKIRIILPLERPVPAQDWPVFWDYYHREFFGGCDQACKSVERAYYLPSKLAGAPSEIYRRKGKLLPVPDALPEVASEPILTDVAVDKEVLEKIAKKWLRSADAKRMTLGARLAKVLKGESFADIGERDIMLFNLCNMLISEMQEIEPESLAKLFVPSLSRMSLEHPEGALTTQDVVSKVVRAKQNTQQHRAKVEAEGQAAQRALIRQAFGGDRSESYSDSELESMASALGVERAVLNKAWIVQVMSFYYVLGPGLEYKLANAESLLQTCERWLAPAPVELTKMTEKGVVKRSRQELLQDYGTVVSEVRKSLVINNPKLTSDRLTLPALKLRPVDAIFHQEVETWLNLLAGDKIAALKAWLAFATELDKPLPALYMTGERGAGKSLIGKALSRLWTTNGPSNLALAMGGFDDTILSCPVLFADEELPKSGGVAQTAKLRYLIQTTQRRINVKYGPMFDLDGAVRIVVAGNNDDLLETGGHLTRHDVEAIAERFLHLNVTQDVKDYLHSLGARAYIDPHWLDKDYVAQHITWIRQHERPEWSGRFGIDHDSSGVVQRMSVKSTLPGLICGWLVQVIMADSPAKDELSFSEQSIGVTVNTLYANWDIVGQRSRTPSISRCGEGLKELSSSSKSIGQHVVYEVPLEKLLVWSEETGFYRPQAIEEKVKSLCSLNLVM